MFGLRIKLDPLINTLTMWLHLYITVHEALPHAPT